jgi:ABC-type branched-subunit amino acid transport system ATPase component
VQYGKAQALQDVSIHVHEREFVSVVGLNGAGKTTLFNTISGLLPYAGEIRRQGATLRAHSAAAIARGGIVQCPEGRELFTDMTVRENLDLGGQHLPDAEAADQIAWLFDLFPILRERQRQAAGTLSGGEQQMLTIARALMMKPKLLMLDEPTLGRSRGRWSACAKAPPSPCCSPSRTLPSRCRTPTASTFSNTPASSGKVRRQSSPPRWGPDICRAARRLCAFDPDQGRLAP